MKLTDSDMEKLLDRYPKESITINSTGEISLEQIETLSGDGYGGVYINNSGKKDFYDMKTFYLIKKSLLEMIKSIPEIPQVDPNREKILFAFICTKIADSVSFDSWAQRCTGLSGYDLDMAQDYIDDAKTMVGPVTRGAGLSSGFCELLRNALSEVGIEAIDIPAGGRTRGERRQWCNDVESSAIRWKMV
jgi:hypothetical protein